jgi:hypothetical protein
MTLHLPRLRFAFDPLIAEARERKRRRRLLVAVAVILLAAGAASATVVLRGSDRSRPTVVLCGPSLGLGLLPSVAHPLSCATRMTPAKANASLGVPLVLPKTALVRPSDMGRVWGIVSHRAGRRTGATVAATFPAQGVIIEYNRPAPSNGSAAHFQAVAEGIPAAKAVRLNGTPALVIRQNSDMNRNNFGGVLFNLNGSEVRVLAHRDQATLEGLALSILNRSTASRNGALGN